LLPVTAPKNHADAKPAKVLALLAVEAALEKKAEQVLVMDIREVSGVADFFVLCTGTSEYQIKAIQASIEERLRDEAQERPWHREGQGYRQWVLLDYVDLVVHIFTPERRAFYDLERLWNDAPHELVTDEGEVAMLQ